MDGRHFELRHYCSRSVLVLPPEATALEAARAMTERHVGAVVVAIRPARFGIVTDRDLTVLVLGAGLDPRSVKLGHLVRHEARVVDVRFHDLDDAIATMCEVGCRRVPIVDRGRLIGMVTLADLLADRAIDPDHAAQIVRAQIEEPGPTRAGAHPHPSRAASRHAAHAARSLAMMLEAVGDRTGIAAQGRRELALEIVLGSICRRIRPEAARRFAAQLPSALQGAVLARLDGPQKWITRRVIEDELCHVLGVERARAGWILDGVTDAVAECVSAGAIERVASHLPWEMKDLFRTARAESRGRPELEPSHP